MTEPLTTDRLVVDGEVLSDTARLKLFRMEEVEGENVQKMAAADVAQANQPEPVPTDTRLAADDGLLEAGHEVLEQHSYPSIHTDFSRKQAK